MQIRPEFQEDFDEEVRALVHAANLANHDRIAQEVADELHTLRAAQSTDSASQISGTPHSQMIVGGQSPAPFQATSHASVSSNSSSSGQRNSDSSQLQWLELADDEIVLDQTVHGVFVSSTRILTLFYQCVCP